jgi:hypothetical protein
MLTATDLNPSITVNGPGNSAKNWFDDNACGSSNSTKGNTSQNTGPVRPVIDAAAAKKARQKAARWRVRRHRSPLVGS